MDLRHVGYRQSNLVELVTTRVVASSVRILEEKNPFSRALRRCRTILIGVRMRKKNTYVLDAPGVLTQERHVVKDQRTKRSTFKIRQWILG